MWLLLIITVLLPGLCMASWVFQRQVVVLLATPLSLLLYVGIAVALYLLDRTDWVLWGYLGVTIFVTAITLAYPPFRTQLGRALIEVKHVLPILLALIAYHMSTGAFVDFGVDAYRHMVYVQKAIETIRESGGLRMSLTLGNNNLVFHNIAALFAVNVGIGIPQLMEVTSLSYSLVWTLSVYCFCFLFFEHVSTSEKQTIFLTYLSVFFYWTTFGINNFSFPRYYYGGPVILNYCVYLAALWLLLRQYIKGFSVRDSVTIVVLTTLAGFLHEQEALMVVIFAMGLALIVIILRFLGVRTTRDVPINGVNTIVSILVLTSCAVGLLLLIYRLPKYSFDPIPLLNLGGLSQRLVGWNILRPDHQFYTVLGFWGLYVYAVSLIYFKQIGRSAILLVTLLLPFITVFNPIFVEAFSKLAYPQVLWRALFALQIPILASYVVGIVFFHWRNETSSWVNMFRLSTIVPMLVLLLPFQFGSFSNSMTKVPSLTKTPDTNSYKQWEDLVEYLNGLEARYNVLTDPVTGYAVRALTHQHHDGYKFFPINFKQFNFESYEEKPLEKYRNSLLIVNLRNGDINSRLNPPHHIYPDVMEVGKYYGLPLIEEIRSNPDNYQTLWSKDQISVYRIQ